ncbi:MAG: outer membrane beta-barrel protein [Lentimicrobiaceae bacterium]|jgi:hypothetical protein
MKNSFLSLITIFLLLNFATVQAQQSHSYWIHGVAGLSSNWIINQNAYGNPEMDYSTTLGLSAEGGLNYFLTDRLGLEGSIMMINLGQNYAGLQAGGNAERKIKLTYFDVPISFMINIPYTHFPTWLSFGPDFMVLLNAHQEYKRVGGSLLPFPDRMATGNINDRYNQTDVAVHFALNKMFPVNNSSQVMILLSVNSAFGLTDINSKEWQIPNSQGDYGSAHNFYFGIKAGVMYKINKYINTIWNNEHR